jgi:phosphate uptake regulator
MPRTVLDEGLRDLHTHLIQVAQEVESALIATVTALETGVQQGLPHLIAQRFSIHRSCTVTEQQALRLLTLQQPLHGPDLRFLTAALFISEHVGLLEDAVVQVAETLLQAASLRQQTGATPVSSLEDRAVDQQGRPTEVFIVRGLLLLGQEIQYFFAATIEALAQRDAGKARTLESEHAYVALRYTPICQDIEQMQAHLSWLSSQQRDPFLPQRLSSLLWIAHKLAEMATSLSTICHRIIFIVEG